jgi:LysM repeat protein
MVSQEITEDYYNTLGVNQNATLEQITRSYQLLASEVRPRNGGYTQAYEPVRKRSLPAELTPSRNLTLTPKPHSSPSPTKPCETPTNAKHTTSSTPSSDTTAQTHVPRKDRVNPSPQSPNQDQAAATTCPPKPTETSKTQAQH